MPRGPECKPARILCFCGRFSTKFFGQISATILAPKLWPKFAKTENRNRKTARPKSENGHSNFQKMLKQKSRNEFFCVENRPKFWPKSDQNFGRKSAKVFCRNMVSRPLQTHLQDAVTGSLWGTSETPQNEAPGKAFTKVIGTHLPTTLQFSLQ